MASQGTKQVVKSLDNNSDNSKKSYLTRGDMDEEVNAKMNKLFASHQHTEKLSRYFSEQALPWLLNNKKDNLTKDNITDILDNFETIVLNETEMYELIKTQMNEAISAGDEEAQDPEIARIMAEQFGDYSYLTKLKPKAKFGDCRAHGLLTRAMMDRLGKELPKLWESMQFCSEYATRLMPKETFHYHQQSWQSEVPDELKHKIVRKLYQWIINHDKINKSIHNEFRAAIIWKYMYFMYNTFGEFDIEAIIEYLHIPKNSYWCEDWLLQQMDDDENFAEKNHVCEYQGTISAFSFFNDQDPWSYEEDHQFLEAFFTKLFSNLQWWENFQKDAKELKSDIAKKWMKKVSTAVYVVFFCLFFFSEFLFALVQG